MPKNKTVLTKKISKNKAIINKIKPLITDALKGIEKKSGEKKFEKSINKAAKLLSKKLKPNAVDKKAENTIKEKNTPNKKEIITNPSIENSTVKTSKKEKLKKNKKKNTSQIVEQETSEKV